MFVSEVAAQLDHLERDYTAKHERIRFLEGITRDWRDLFFGRDLVSIVPVRARPPHTHSPGIACAVHRPNPSLTLGPSLPPGTQEAAQLPGLPSAGRAMAPRDAMRALQALGRTAGHMHGRVQELEAELGALQRGEERGNACTLTHTHCLCLTHNLSLSLSLSAQRDPATSSPAPSVISRRRRAADTLTQWNPCRCVRIHA